ncbi:ABC transporter permease [Aquabacterium sp.]|jgi:sulfonate transport system permease protein|uniref:ABC transporter permease n=1 Tax=Aquabacterium sp. TaxID=1872578 RepID=UPI0027BAF58E|nr:ABC transporter permease [Aquabacterium sp.]
MSTSSDSLQVARKWPDGRPLALPLALIALWALATSRGWVDTKVVVPPAQVLATAWQELFNPTFYQGVALSLWRDLSGFALGSTAGVLLGVLLGVSPLARWMIGPTFHSLRQVSLFAWLPLLAAVAGSGDLSKIVFVAFSAFYPMVLATLEGVQGVSAAHAEVARVYGFSGPQRLFRLILPSAAPQILSGIQLALIYAWLGTIGAEFLLYDFSNGLGQIVIKGRSAFRVDVILFGLFVIGLIGYGFARLTARLERHLLRWRPPALH